ncbi:3-hydroxyacyl-ACP dehydratase FabZ [Sulfurihydrogenibium azorense]|uniref:3-hydroxyacyl-[acyl-carrier-protein] dehydratase FabZ n=1 Tax=Sulfurihydrogenibium azorense (strain DSM 15241 / OCM 825 / Az-Fu1) TaxID=204536 RepID=C1DUW7_SULAA|nr:3-hydroxyacyl-ACP dehydratase FabZ [Sulfurihydrogenibium azorense]ACN98736.1 beta-hydroxyacyl-(acyl-carrier-protein) dehydratase FabZ [Sulfurihydrogenibium azorense Az-Fu1]
MENVMDIMKVLPHRYPFLLVDRILELDVENMKIKALKNVTYNEPFFVGHFPDNPVMPGVLIIEAMAQVGAYLMLKKANITNGTVLFASIEEAKFRKPVVPGDQIIFEVEGINIKRSMGKIKAVAKVDGQVVCEAILMAAVK